MAARQRVGLLSGSYEQHRIIAHRVMREGWELIRAEAHEEIAEPRLAEIAVTSADAKGA
jgi:hypothetical protein